MTNIDKDVRTVLLGRTSLLEDGRLISYAPGEFNIMNGISDGAGSVLFFGMSRRSRVCSTKFSERKACEAARKAMQEIGRGVVLRSDPEVPACLIRYILTKPAVVTFTYAEGVPVVTVYAGRGLTALISIRRAFAAFADELPEGMTVTKEKGPEPPKEDREKKKKEKKEKKEKKKKRKAGEDESSAEKAEEAAQAGETQAEAAQAAPEAAEDQNKGVTDK